MHSTVTVIASVATMAMLFGEIFAMPPVQCSPAILNEVPAKVREICSILSTIYQLSSAMESYVDDRVSVLQGSNRLPVSGVKRQDVDHVFLRFGRRRR